MHLFYGVFQERNPNCFKNEANDEADMQTYSKSIRNSLYFACATRKQLGRHKKTEDKLVNEGAGNHRIGSCLVEPATAQSCGVCGKIFVSNRIFKKHMLAHSKFGCHTCSAKFQNQVELKAHVMQAHHAIDILTTQYSEMINESIKFRNRKTFTGTVENLNKFAGCEDEAAVNNMAWLFSESDKAEVISKVTTVRTNTSPHRKLVSCDICTHKFRSLKLLTMHMKKHLPDNEFGDGKLKYSACDESLNSCYGIIQHIALRNSDSSKKITRNETCDICGQQFSSLVQHLIMEHASRYSLYCYTCKCDHGLDKHLTQYKNRFLLQKDFFKCAVCHKQFSVRNNHLQRTATCDEKPQAGNLVNQQSILVKQLHKCRLCNFTADSQPTFRMHMKTHQVGFECDICGKKFTRQLSLERHRKGHDLGNTLMSCPVCGKWFTRESLMKNHIEGHYKKLTCEICKQTFDGLRALKTHQVSHRGILSYICEVCGEKCKSADLLSIHSQTHNLMPGQNIQSILAEGKRALAEKRARNARYACDKCGKRFSAIFHLQIHMNYHSGDKPFKCDKCDKCYRY